MAVYRRVHHVALRLFSTLSTPAPEKPSRSLFRTVKSAIRAESDPEKLAETFQKHSDLILRSHLDRSVFNLAVQKLIKFRRFDLIERILDAQMEDQSSLSSKREGFWIRIMMLYSDAGMVDQAVRVFNRMEELGCIRTEKSLCALLSVFLENRQFSRLHEAFAEIPAKMRISPGIVAHNLVLKAFCKEKSVDSARSLVDKLEEENGVKPDITSYNILLDGYLRNWNENGFDEILKKIPEKLLSPTLVTYNLRLSKLCKNKENVRAKKLLDEMVSNGVEPNATTYNIIIDGFCKVADFESAKKVLEDMRSNDSISPTSDTYFTLIHHLVEEGEIDLALEMCKESIGRKWVPPFVSMEGLVNGLVKISKVDEAKAIVEKMKKRLRGNAVDSWMKIEGALPLLEAN